MTIGVRASVAGLFMAVALYMLTTTLYTSLFSYDNREEVFPSEASARASATTNSLSPPVRIIIPAIGVDAKVEQLGQTITGAMMAPEQFSEAGWYKYGSTPGEKGAAIIAGHLDNGLGLNGVFKKLGELKRGDTVEIELQSGEKKFFRITEKETYPYEEVPANVFSSTDEHAILHLITCAGGWVNSRAVGMTYDHRLVVRAVLI